MMPVDATLIDDFHRDGYVMLPEAITKDQLSRLTSILDQWVEDSRAHAAPYGETIDKRPRFDIQPDTHSPKTPALRRVASPVEISDDYWEVAKDNPALDLTAAIFSPNIKFYASKINCL